MCSNSFGILDDQLVLECTNRDCGEQYCSKCVECIQGASAEHSFTCLSCQKNIHSKQYLIWPSIAKLYGTSSLLDLKDKLEFLSCQPILKDMDIRLLHLQSRLRTYKKNFIRTIVLQFCRGKSHQRCTRFMSNSKKSR